MKEKIQQNILVTIKTRVQKFFSRPHILFLLFALLILLVPLFFWGQGLNIVVSKFTIIMHSNHFIYVLSLVCFLFWILYRFTNKFLLTVNLTWIHLVITVVIFLYFFESGLWFPKVNEKDKVQASILQQLMINKVRSLRVISVTGIIFISAQFLYLVNLIAGLIKRRKKTELKINSA